MTRAECRTVVSLVTYAHFSTEFNANTYVAMTALRKSDSRFLCCGHVICPSTTGCSLRLLEVLQSPVPNERQKKGIVFLILWELWSVSRACSSTADGLPQSPPTCPFHLYLYLPVWKDRGLSTHLIVSCWNTEIPDMTRFQLGNLILVSSLPCNWWDWRDDSAVKIMGSSSRWPGFSSQNPQLLTIRGNSTSRASGALFWPLQVLQPIVHRHACTQDTPTQNKYKIQCLDCVALWMCDSMFETVTQIIKTKLHLEAMISCTLLLLREIQHFLRSKPTPVQLN